MPIITLQYKGKQLKEYHISSGQTLTIGRNDSNDIVIDNLAVSGTHARISSVSSTFVVTDLASTNGTFVNKEPISEHSLGHNDVILIGKHELLFDRSDIDQKEQKQKDLQEEDKTLHLDTAEYRELINKAKGKTASSAPPKPETPTSTPKQEKEGGFLSRMLKKIF